MVLFLGLPFAVTLEAFVLNNVFSKWDVQRDENGPVRAVASSSKAIGDPGKRAERDMPLAELERPIAVVAAVPT
jgi:hypothetical protein